MQKSTIEFVNMRLRVISYAVLIVLSISLFSSNQCVKAEDKEQPSLLFYSEKNDYLLPFIENTLKELKHKRLNKKLFRLVVNLNKTRELQEHQFNLREIIDFYNPEKFVDISDQDKRRYEELANQLIRYDLLLIIKINTLQELLEYQLTLYSINSQSMRSSNIVVPDPINSIHSLSLFINPKSEEYLYKLESTIKQLFPESNEIPFPIVEVNSKPNRFGKVFTFGVGEIITLDASKTIDNDTPRQYFIYNWRQIDPEGNVNVPKEMLLDLSPQIPSQKISFNKPGDYIIGVTINDGIGTSKEEIIKFHILYQPKISLSKKNFIYHFQNSLFSILSSRKQIKGEFEVSLGYATLEESLQDILSGDRQKHNISYIKSIELDIQPSEERNNLYSKVNLYKQDFNSLIFKDDSNGLIFSEKSIVTAGRGEIIVSFEGDKSVNRNYSVYARIKDVKNIKSNIEEISFITSTSNFWKFIAGLEMLNIVAQDTLNNSLYQVTNEKQLNVAAYYAGLKIYFFAYLSIEYSLGKFSSENKFIDKGSWIHRFNIQLIPTMLRQSSLHILQKKNKYTSLNFALLEFPTLNEGKQTQLGFGFEMSFGQLGPILPIAEFFYYIGIKETPYNGTSIALKIAFF